MRPIAFATLLAAVALRAEASPVSACCLPDDFTASGVNRP